jgi:hypothetical protein
MKDTCFEFRNYRNAYVFYINNCQLANKVGGIISVAGGLGHLGVQNLFNTFFSAHRMLSADFVSGFAGEKGLIKKDKHAMKAAAELLRDRILQQST